MMPTPTQTPSKAPKGRPARERAAALREASRAADRRRRRRNIAVIAVLVLAVAVGITVQTVRSTAGGAYGAPVGVTSDGTGFAVGPASAPVTVEVYEDFICPACASFEEAVGGQLREMTTDGAVRVVYRPMAFLDSYSTTRYSTRALNAAACASDGGRFAEMHAALFANIPAEGSAGLSDSKLVDIGERAGVKGSDFGACVTSLGHERFTQRATEAASKAGIVQTPTVLVNGETLAVPTADGLRDAVAKAAG